ncbi:MAG: tetratricopeptide repeat protein [Desulfobacterales bacterium]|nr:tetratricopeptide repeat protein [Desulfobacterales bacterium]MDX2512262.1 tetratricopeptide repeat protein [Desulfobacterales bacterium]
MNRYTYSILLSMLLLVFSCGGGSVKKDPTPTHPAMKQLQKGIAWYQRGCFQESLEAFTKAHELFTASDRLPDIAMSLNNIGNVYRYIGDSQSAFLFFQEAYEIYSRLDNLDGAIQALSNQAAIQIQDNRLDEAAATIQTAEKMAESYKKNIVHVLNNKGILLTRQHRYDDAETVLLQALEATTPDNTQAYATVCSSLGSLMLEKTDYDQAIEFYEKALSLDRQSDFYPGLADNLNAVGRIYLQQKKYDQATAYFQRSIKIYALFGNKEQVSRTMNLLEEAATQSNTNLTLTRYFVDKWSKGEILEHPCQ